MATEPPPAPIDALEAYRIVMAAERATIVAARDELMQLSVQVNDPLGTLVSSLPQFAGPRSGAVTKIRGFYQSLASWRNQLDTMVSQLNVEITKYDQIDPPASEMGGRRG